MRVAGAVTALAIGLSACTTSATTPPSRRPDPTPAESAGAAKTFDGWAIKVRIRPQRIGPLELAVGPLRAAPTNEAEPWVRHKVVFRNLGERPLRFVDTRTSKFLRLDGQPRLLAADEGCGYGIKSPGAAVDEGACDLYLDAFVVKPGAAVTREITLWKNLPGMAEVEEATYRFRKKILFKVGRGGSEYDRMIATSYLVRTED